VKTSLPLISRLNEYMDGLAGREYFNGAVLVVRDDQILLCGGYGMASFEHEVPNLGKTKFRIGSLTKSFTAIAILQLQEQGKLNVNDPVSRYFPDYPKGDRITLHHLLAHSSGIPDYPGFPCYWERTMKLYSTIDQMIGYFKNEPLLFHPGEGSRYSNSNYILLSSIIEKVSGISYEAYISTRICGPLQMNDIGVEDGRTMIKHFSSGYSVCKQVIPAEYVDMTIHVGAGAMYSTVEDLYLWDRALYRNDLLGKPLRELLFETPTSSCGSYGWVVSERVLNDRPTKCVWHIGTMNGFCAEIDRYVEANMAVIVLSNLNITPVWKISED